MALLLFSMTHSLKRTFTLRYDLTNKDFPFWRLNFHLSRVIYTFFATKCLTLFLNSTEVALISVISIYMRMNESVFWGLTVWANKTVAA